MPFIAQDLIEGRSLPITVHPDDPAQQALELMIENSFSQLPVVDTEDKPLGLITSDSILQSSAHLNMPLDRLKVARAIQEVDYYPADYPIIDLLKSLNTYPAVLIINSESRLIGIITNWDTAAYFRKRAVDLMFLEDVEDLLREHIRAAFSDTKTGLLDELHLQSAINEIVNTGNLRLKDFKGALKRYVNLASINHNLQDNFVEEAFSGVAGRKIQSKTLRDLTFNEYMELLFHKSVWQTYGQRFNLPEENLRQLLDGVRKSRNDVAHFRREITELERRQIRYCKQLLEDNRPATIPEDQRSSLTENTDDEILPAEETISGKDSMYAPLAIYLHKLPANTERQQFTFDEIEKIIGVILPDSAREHRSWWANDSVGHVQSQQWLGAGWRVSAINMSDGVVTFSRSRDRERAYIRFFSALLKELRDRLSFEVHNASPDGSSWVTAKALPRNSRQLAWLNFSFSQQKQFRAELYIDTGDKGRNKRIFNHLFDQKEAIEEAFGNILSWERLDTRRACRIASYQDGFITENDEKLTELCHWGVDAMIRLEKAIADRAENALAEIE